MELFKIMIEKFRPYQKILQFFTIFYQLLESFENFNPIRPEGEGGGPFCPLLNKLIVNFLWMDIITSIPYGFSSFRYLQWLLKSNIMSTLQM